MTMRLPFPLALALALSPTALAQSTWYVDRAAAGPGTGTLADPYAEIQTAILSSTTLPGDRIEVAAGIYLPIDFSGKSLAIVGAPGAEIDGADAAPCALVVSGEGPGTRLEGLVLRDGRGSFAAPGGGVRLEGATLEIVACEVRGSDGGPEGGGVLAGPGSTLTLDGTLLTGNDADLGAGVYALDSAVTITNCTFDANSTQGGQGGGLWASGGTLTVEDSMFTANHAFMGAGAKIDVPTAHFEDCTFTGNTDPLGCFQGGAIDATSGTVVDCVFEANYGQFGGALHGGLEVSGSRFTANGFDNAENNFGGAFHWGFFATASATDCLFEDNFCWGRGGACVEIDLVDCKLIGNRATEDPSTFQSAFGGGLYGGTALRCVFERNRAVGFGSMVAVAQGGAAYQSTLERCVLRQNEAAEGGGAYLCTIDRCTVIDNVATDLGGGAVGGPSIRNSIVRGNVPTEIEAAGALPTVEWSNVEGGATGTGNFDAAPQFFGPLSGDVHLFVHSPCIDAGDPTRFDADGTRLDVGAFPYDPTWVGAPGGYCSAKVTSTGCTPYVVGIGDGRLSGPGFTCEARDVLGGTFGLAFWGALDRELTHVGGTLCVGGPLLRTPVVQATGTGDCDGVLAYTFTPQDLLAAGFAPGRRVHVQWFFRDVLHPDGTGLGLSDGLEVALLP